MPILRRTHRRPVSFYEGSSYTPNQIGDWVAVTGRDVPWNTIGQALKGANDKGGTEAASLMTAAEVLDQTGLDVHVHKVPTKDGETGRVIPRMFVTAADLPDGERQYFGAVSDKYEVVQPREALSFFDEVIRQYGGAHYSAAWNMREKSMMGVTIELPDEIVVDPDGAADRIGLHLLGINSFDGSTGLTGALDATRWFCMNQLTPALRNAKRSFTLRHTKNVRDRAVDASRMIGVTLDYARALDGVANALHAVPMTEDQFTRFLAKVPQFSLDGTESDLVTTRVRARREEAVAAWNAPHNANISGTRWGALNVVGEFMEWGRTVKGSTRTGTDPERQRAIGTLVHPTVSGTVTEAAERLLQGVKVPVPA